jgi:hypothetical protein
MTNKELQIQIDCLDGKIEELGKKNSEKRLERLEEKIGEFANKLSWAMGAFSLATVVAIAVASFALAKIGEINNLRASNDSLNELLVKQIEIHTGKAINQFNIVKASDQEKLDIVELKKLAAGMERLEYRGDKLKGMEDLVDVLDLIVLQNKVVEASDKLQVILNENPKPGFIQSRARTLDHLIMIAANRNSPPLDMKKANLQAAILADNTNAGAFNALGIVIANESRTNFVEKGDPAGAINLMKQAIVYFNVAAALNSSSIGKFKAMNNTIWVHLTVLRGLMLKNGPDSDEVKGFLTDINYRSAADFFESSIKELDVYENSTNLPAPLETIAQLMFAQAEYLRASKFTAGDAAQIAKADELEAQGADKFEKAVDRGLCNRVKNPEEAVSQFRKDYLHQSIISSKPDLIKKIIEKLNRVFPPPGEKKTPNAG